MNVRKRSGLMKGAVGSAPKNTVTSRMDAVTQAKPIKNAINSPKPCGVYKVKGAVSDNH